MGREAAAALAVDDGRVFKTIITTVDGAPTVAVVPVSADLDLMALAAAVGGLEVSLCEAAEVEKLTGYPADAVAPVGHATHLTTVVDASALDFKTIYVCAGSTTTDFELAPEDLVAVTRARTAPLTQHG